MSKTKLLNCPFCGGEAKMQRIINLDDFDDFFIMCEKCFSRTKKFKAERSAILVWNTRKPMERILERLETESDLAEKEMERAREQNPLQYERCDSYICAIDNAIEIVKEGGIE